MVADLEQTTEPGADCPYVGVRAYEEHERHLFVGREQETELVMNKILAERLTVLFAPSGTGKSSLLCAGVIPKVDDSEQRDPALTKALESLQRELHEEAGIVLPPVCFSKTPAQA